MKIQFDTPLTGTDASGTSVTLTPAQIAGLTFNVLIDTVNPPVKSYAIPAQNLTAATTNPNGSKHVMVDAVNDLKITLTAGSTYYIGITDALGNQVSTETAVISYVDVITPGQVANFTVS
jgi:hypothetical protein